MSSIITFFILASLSFVYLRSNFVNLTSLNLAPWRLQESNTAHSKLAPKISIFEKSLPTKGILAKFKSPIALDANLEYY